MSACWMLEVRTGDGFWRGGPLTKSPLNHTRGGVDLRVESGAGGSWTQAPFIRSNGTSAARVAQQWMADLNHSANPSVAVLERDNWVMKLVLTPKSGSVNKWLLLLGVAASVAAAAVSLHLAATTHAWLGRIDAGLVAVASVALCGVFVDLLLHKEAGWFGRRFPALYFAFVLWMFAVGLISAFLTFHSFSPALTKINQEVILLGIVVPTTIPLLLAVAGQLRPGPVDRAVAGANLPEARTRDEDYDAQEEEQW